VNEDSKRFVNETAEGLKYHLKLGMDNLSAKMATSSHGNRVPPAEASSYFTDKYVARDFFDNSTPIMSMMKRKWTKFLNYWNYWNNYLNFFMMNKPNFWHIIFNINLLTMFLFTKILNMKPQMNYIEHNKKNMIGIQQEFLTNNLGSTPPRVIHRKKDH